MQLTFSSLSCEPAAEDGKRQAQSLDEDQAAEGAGQDGQGAKESRRQGAVRDLRTGEITTAEPGDELPIQTCINAVAGTCDLEI